VRRPTSFTVFAILCFVFGGFAVLGFLMALPIYALEAGRPAENPAYEALVQPPGLMTYTKVANVLALLTAPLLVAAGVGLMRMRAWARTLCIVYGAYGVAAAVVGLVFNLAVYLPAIQDAAAAQPTAMRTGMIGGVVFAIIAGVICGLGWPIALLIFSFRRATVDALRATPPAPDEPVPGPR
jgi:hypothetical protein